MPPRKQDSSDVYVSLKHGHTTTFVLANLLKPIQFMIKELLSALSARYPNGIPADSEESSRLPLPSDLSYVRIAKLHDNTNSDKGWSEIPWVKYEENKAKNCLRAWDVQGGAKLAFAFAEDDAEITKLRTLSEEEEEDMVKKEATGFWVEWPNFEWIDQEGEGDEEEETMKRTRDDEEDARVSAREKRRRVLDDDDGDDQSDMMNGSLDGDAVSTIAQGYTR